MNLAAHRVIALQLRGGQSGAGACQGVKDAPARDGDPDDLSHNLQGLLRLVQSFGALNVGGVEDSRQASHAAIKRQRAVAGPNQELCLLPEASPLRARCQFVPYHYPAIPRHKAGRWLHSAKRKRWLSLVGL